jgi:hypothetical protein
MRSLRLNDHSSSNRGVNPALLEVVVVVAEVEVVVLAAAVVVVVVMVQMEVEGCTGVTNIHTIHQQASKQNRTDTQYKISP